MTSTQRFSTIVVILAALKLAAGIGLVLSIFGCTYNRNAPLINVEDSANGNTVPVSAVP